MVIDVHEMLCVTLISFIQKKFRIDGIAHDLIVLVWPFGKHFHLFSWLHRAGHVKRNHFLARRRFSTEFPTAFFPSHTNTDINCILSPLHAAGKCRTLKTMRICGIIYDLPACRLVTSSASIMWSSRFMIM